MKTTLVALNAQYMHANLAIRQMLHGLKNLDVRFFEGHINLPHRQLLSEIARGAPDVVGFSCYIWNIRQVLRLCRALKAAFPGIRIVLGGPEVAYCPEDVLKDNPEVDFVLSGEGERTLAPLLRALASGAPLADVPGLSYRDGGKTFVNPRPAPLPPPLWPDPYSEGIEGLERRILYVETSRGCPFRCGFCLSGAEPGVRALDAGEAIRRLTHLADAGAQLIKLVDRTFNFDRGRASAIWAGLIGHARRTGFGGTYHFEIAARLIDANALEVLSAAPKGLFQFEVGIQSTDPGVLESVGRPADFPRIVQAVRQIRSLGTIHLHVDLIAGLPGDDMRKFARSFDDAYALGADMLQLGFLKLLPGCTLRRDAARLGIAFEPDAPYEVLGTPDMRFSELDHLKDVERVLEWYGARYPLTLRWSLRGGGSPFALFSSLAARYRAAGVFDAERAEKARAQALLDAFDGPELRALMRHDLLRVGRRRDLPDALAFSEDEAHRALLRERFRPVRGQSAFTYDFDVTAFERGEGLMKKRTLVIYER